MRLTTKRIREAQAGCKNIINQAFQATEPELLTWAKRIMPIQSGERVELLRIIVEDVIDRSFDPLHIDRK